MPQLLSEHSAAWKLVAVGVIRNYSVCSLDWELQAVGGKGGSAPPPLGHWCPCQIIFCTDAKKLDQRTRNEVPYCPRQLYYFNPFHKLITLHINEVMKGAVPGGQEVYTGSS